MVAAEFERWLDLAISKLTGCIGMIGNNNIIYWGYIGIMEKKMETTIIGYIVI